MRWRQIHDIAVEGAHAFVEDELLTRGAAIAFYAAAALPPILYIFAVVAGMIFGREAAGAAITGELSHIIGNDGTKLLQIAVRNSNDPNTGGVWANILGALLLIVTASGFFSEIQTALNVIWNAKLDQPLAGRLIRARVVSLGLVLAFAFVMISSVLITAAINAFGARIAVVFPIGLMLAHSLDFLFSFVLLTLLLAAIYRVLPDCEIGWRDVFAGAIGTTVLFNLGEYLITLYLSSSAWKQYGASASMLILLTWIFYTAQIFLLGAAFTQVWSHQREIAKAERRLASNQTP
jgi:membrane protein